MKYILMHMTEMDLFCDEYHRLEDAIADGDYKWRNMDKEDKEDTIGLWCIKSMNPNDYMPDNHFMGILKKVWK